MDIETLFSSTRWDILKILSQKKLSPIELSLSLNTTPANISQQLRLLELAGLVKSEKTKNVDKGKPRIVYSLASEVSYLIFAASDFSEKKLLHMTSYHRFMLRTFFIENLDHHEILGRLYFKLQPYLENASLIAAVSQKRDLEVFIVATNSKTIPKIEPEANLKISIVSKAELLPKNAIVLFGPDYLIGKFEVKK